MQDSTINKEICVVFNVSFRFGKKPNYLVVCLLLCNFLQSVKFWKSLTTERTNAESAVKMQFANCYLTVLSKKAYKAMRRKRFTIFR